MSRVESNALSLRGLRTTSPAAINSVRDEMGRAEQTCRHCGAAIGATMAYLGKPFCCTGCEAVFQLLNDRGLTRFYALRGEHGVPAVAAQTKQLYTPAWLEALEAELASAKDLQRLELDIQGLHCSGCVWLISELFKQKPHALECQINPSLGRVTLFFEPGFALGEWIRDIEHFGYRLGLARKTPLASDSRRLLTRLGICVALAANTMMFSAAVYFGLVSGPIYELMRHLNFAFATLALGVGGSVFFRSAYQALRRGVVHFDVPLSLGMILSYVGSVIAYVRMHEQAVFFDSVVAFITLMLLGRFLQQRVLEQNRARLLESDGVEQLQTRRVRDGRPEVIACGQISEGDVLLIAPGDLVPVDSALLAHEARYSLEWINGESAPRYARQGATIVAGSFNVGSAAIRVCARTAIDASPLRSLLRQNKTLEGETLIWERWWQLIAKLYVAVVLVAALGSFLTWGVWLGDVPRALDVAAAVLIVTCPCAFAIATPLAYELVFLGLQRAGIFVRSGRFLDRAALVKRVVFDKTGTLTQGMLKLRSDESLRVLNEREKQALYDLVARSHHPKSNAVRSALEPLGLKMRAEVFVEEFAGKGVEARIDGRVYRLGSAAFVEATSPGAGGDALFFSVDGELRARLSTEEILRDDAAVELGQLGQDHDVWILSGDDQHAVDALAKRVGVDWSHARGGLNPGDKAAWLRAHAEMPTLFIGDGVNDTEAARVAFCSGTPAIERPVVLSNADFYFIHPGLKPIGLSLRIAKVITKLRNRYVVFAAFYNFCTIAVAWAGWMRPWMAAVLMPTSSLLLIAVTLYALSEKRSVWRY